MAKIKYEQNIQEKESMQKMEAINDDIHLTKEKSRADADFYKIERSATANKLLLSPEYLELKKIEAMSVNNKVFITSQPRLTSFILLFPRSTLVQTSQICSSMKGRKRGILPGNLHLMLPPIVALSLLSSLCFRLTLGKEKDHNKKS